MGMMDRDYMHAKDRQRPFTPPPQNAGIGVPGKILIFLALLFVFYKIADWTLSQRAVPRAAQQAAETATRPDNAAPPAVTPNIAPPLSPASPEASDGTRVVTKCVGGGKTSYGDSACAPGATSTQITTLNNHNLVVAVRPQTQTHTDTIVSQETVVTQNSPAPDGKNAECQALDAAIKNLDAMARQPQSASMQDWIKEERKKLRDRQYRVPCR